MEHYFHFKLQTDAILNVPLQICEDDFLFIVNGQEIQTSRLIADLLSPKICNNHRNDPSMNEIIINTKHQGNFLHILDLIKFNNITIPENEVLFFYEVLQNLDNDQIKKVNDFKLPDLTEENTIQFLQKRLAYPNIYENEINEEIDFISSHFYSICDRYNDELKTINYDYLYRIISNDKLHLKDEDQLLNFLNSLYIEKVDDRICELYEFVLFANVQTSSIDKFIDIFDYNDLTNETWTSITNRLKQTIIRPNINSIRYGGESNSYRRDVKTFLPKKSDQFKGIIKYLSDKSNKQIEKEIDITTSSFCLKNPPSNVAQFDNRESFFQTSRSQIDNWICFDFKDRKVIPTHYQLMSSPRNPNNNHPKSWIVEGSNDNSNWIKLDEQTDCSYLNGYSLSHLFDMNNSKSSEFQYIRIRLTGNDWFGGKYLKLNLVEFYGHMI